MKTFLRILNPLDRSGLYIAPHLIVTLVLGGVLALAGAFTVRHFQAESGGFKQAPLPKDLVLRGGPLPAAKSLVKFLVRQHDQGPSGSCVGQTLATMEEMTYAERGYRIPFSSGYIWNQLNGCSYSNGATYPDAFGILTGQGDAPLSAFSPDGATGYCSAVTSDAIQQARRFHTTRWYSISPADRYTIKSEIMHGRPLAVAMPVYSSFLNHFNDPSPIYSQGGSYEFNHSMVIVSYSPFGPELQNSWSGNWGNRGRIAVSWDFLANNAFALVVSVPQAGHQQGPPPPPKKHYYPFPIRNWTFWTWKHHKHAIAANEGKGKYKHRRWEARAWFYRGRWKTWGSIVSEPRYYVRGKHGRDGFVTTRFQARRYYWWVHHPGWEKIEKVYLIR